MLSLDDRLRSAGSEVTHHVGAMPLRGADEVMHHVRQRRRMARAGVAAIVLCAVVAGAGLAASTRDTRRSDVLGSGGNGATATTIGGDSGVSDLADVPYLGVGLDEWRVLDAVDTSDPNASPGTAGAIPGRHSRYLQRDNDAALASLDVFGVPTGSFYETIVPLFSEADGSTTVEIGGEQARLRHEGNQFALAWRYSDSTIVSLTVSGVADQSAVLAIAESLVELDQAEWDHITTSRIADPGVATTTTAP